MASENTKAGQTPAAERWLREVGLDQYSDLFVQNRIDFDVLPDLSERDLAEIGIPLGDRKRLLRAMASLGGATAVHKSAPLIQAPVDGPIAERRQLTVMFCDLVGSTALSEMLDPEDMRDMIAAYREICSQAVGRYDGFVAQYAGDGILVYYGYPTAHEDDPERAVLSALDIVRTITGQSEAIKSDGSHSPLKSIPDVRIGISTGLVVVGNMIGESTPEQISAVGETPNLAARLQTLAPPNGIIIAPSTYALLGGKFEYEQLGLQSLKGVSVPLKAWRVVRRRRAVTRFAASGDIKLTPLVNRNEEIALLLGRWQHTKQNDGQVVLLSGEPGIGKSRIVREFHERIREELTDQISLQCSPHYTSTAFYPFIEYFLSKLGFDSGGATTVSLDAIEALLATAGMERAVPLFAALLSIDVGDRYGPLNFSPRRQKDETVAALVDFFVGRGRRQSILILIEDTHWIDPTSSEVLDLLVDRTQDASVLVIITCRPEIHPSWSKHSHVTTLTLNRLSRELRADMIGRVTGAKALPANVIEEIVVKTDGVPLFVEELTKAVLESNLLLEKDGGYAPTGTMGHLAIPATLSDSLMARLDRLGPFRRVAQVGAAIGREFSYHLLEAVAQIPAEQLERALDNLEDANLVVRRGHPPEAEYTFKHALVQDAAYSSLLNRERKALHERVAKAIAMRHPDKLEREPELLAHHFTEADQSALAVEYWLKAGKRAARTLANLEAIDHLGRGLAVIAKDPDMPDCDRVELALRIELGILLIAAKGYARPEVEANYKRALVISRKIQEQKMIFAATRGLWVCYFIRAELAKAQSLCAELLELAEDMYRGDADRKAVATGYLIEARRALGMSALYQGSFVESYEHLMHGIKLYDPTLHRDFIEIHGIEPGVVCLSYLGFVLWFLGCPDQARDYSEQALASAERVRDPYTIAFALAFRAYLCQHLRDVAGTVVFADKTIAISSEHGFTHWKHQATLLRGWAIMEQGRIDEGVQLIRAGLDEYEAMDSWLACSWFRCLLADAYMKAGRTNAAMRAIDDAFDVTERTGERFFLAELYRMQGEIFSKQEGPAAASDAEVCYRRSLELACQQGALAWQLRTTVCFARLLRASGNRGEALDLLAPICGKFVEGADTRDVQEAMQLMRELEAP